MAGAIPATDRLRRLLSLVPWVAAQPEGAAIDEVCARFDISPRQLLADLDVVMMVGVYPYTPDSLIEVWVDDDTVTIQMADYFARPLQLTPSEGLALVATGGALASSPGADPDGALAQAVDKVSAVLGSHDAVDIALGEAPHSVFAVLDSARRDRRQVVIDYHSADRDDRTTRTIEPWHLWNADGHWYVSAFCDTAGAERLFRLDRIASIEATTKDFVHEVHSGATRIDFDAANLPEVVVEVEPTAAWLFDLVPVRSRDVLDSGRVRLRLAVASPRWLERVVVQLGKGLTIIEIDDALGDENLAARVAARVLERYR